LESENLDVLVVTETFLGEDILDSELCFLQAATSQQFEDMTLTNCELLWVELMLPATKILIGVFIALPVITSPS